MRVQPKAKGKVMSYSVEVGLTAIVIILVLVIINAIKILREYQRGVILTLGRFTKVKGPGLIFVVPVVQQMVRVDLLVVTMDVHSHSEDGSVGKECYSPCR